MVALNEGEHWREILIKAGLKNLTPSTGSPKEMPSSKSMAPSYHHPRNEEGSEFGSENEQFVSDISGME